MAVMTLTEALKYAKTPLEKGIIKLYIETSPILNWMPFKNINGNAMAYNQIESLPNVGFRSVNEDWTPDVGIVNPVSEKLVIGGGQIKIDSALIDTGGPDILSEQVSMMVTAFSMKLMETILNGDSEASPEVFDGLKKRIVGDQVMDMGSSSGGDELTLTALEDAIDQLDGEPSCIIASKKIIRKIGRLMRAASQAQEQISGAFGRKLNAFAGIPMIPALTGPDGTEILPFTEESPGGGASVCTSLYIVRFNSANGVTGIKNGNITTDNQGKSGIYVNVLVNFYCGMAVMHGKSAVRLRGIKNA